MGMSKGDTLKLDKWIRKAKITVKRGGREFRKGIIVVMRTEDSRLRSGRELNGTCDRCGAFVLVNPETIAMQPDAPMYCIPCVVRDPKLQAPELVAPAEVVADLERLGVRFNRK